KFLKIGANDFIYKPYTNDEFYCRVLNHAQLVESYKEVNRLSLEKNSLLGMTAHDIRGPLGSIVGACRFLLQKSNYKNPERTKRGLKAISETSEQMLLMVNELLDISSIESGKCDLNPIQSSLSDLIEKRIDLIFMGQAAAKEIEILFNPEPAMELIFDVGRITQVIDNFISNAIKFTPVCGVVTINLKREKDRVFFTIKDTGPGLTDEDMKNVFKEFATLSALSTNGEKSTGLGLAICRKIIKLHSGEIGVNPSPDGGAEFYFSLPL
ncbi:MAG: hybrid sensor histidine kinase/response regulator, partial [Spirochaetaceae bacterium]|nr:hybrid sensor histidine kinase/response regulator [Spirochaetaceae bacterium]